MKLSDFIARVQASPVLSGASFGIADGNLCLVGPKGDGRNWHVRILRVDGSVGRESVGAKFAEAFTAAERESARWVMPVEPVEEAPAEPVEA
jgi:hypothetical protein